MNKSIVLAGVALLSAFAASFATIKMTGAPGQEASNTESAYERVIRTQTLRCGYIPFVPNLVKDPNTGALSGLDVEFTEALTRKLGLKIVWAEEVGWGTATAGLKGGRYDAVCNGAWYLPMEAKEAYFSRPYFFQPLFTVARADDTRFDANLDALNDPGASIASMDGDNPQFIAAEQFPKARVFTVSGMTGMPMVLESVATRKADVTFSDPYSFGDYNEHNPGKLKLVQTNNPLRIFPVGFILPLGDDKLRSMIDVAMDELIYGGQVDALLKKYEKYPHNFVPVGRPRIQ
ncbi:MAG: transporter substrate-binding domain-containing protein [Alphaproteobacteria bacterium]|nr:transporter substrate-binding domain-containing protein [Alphaproteobacteria bacterium]